MVSQEIVDEPELKNITKAFLLKQMCIFIYSCATPTLLLPNSKVTAVQQQPYSCAAVNNFAGITQGMDFIISRIFEAIIRRGLGLRADIRQIWTIVRSVRH